MCVLEGWRMIGKRTGGPLRTFPERIGADTARDYESMDMPTALRPQALMAFRLSGEILPRKFGCPFKIRAPTKLGVPTLSQGSPSQACVPADSGVTAGTTGSAEFDR